MVGRRSLRPRSAGSAWLRSAGCADTCAPDDVQGPPDPSDIASSHSGRPSACPVSRKCGLYCIDARVSSVIRSVTNRVVNRCNGPLAPSSRSSASLQESLVRVVGLEPTRCCHRRILSARFAATTAYAGSRWSRITRYFKTAYPTILFSGLGSITPYFQEPLTPMWLPESGQIEADHAYEAHKDRH
jgi:hypothetical protein